MKRSELIKELASEAHVTQTKAREIIKSLTGIITNRLSTGDIVKIDGLGRFHTVTYNSHNIKAVNGSEMCLEPRVSPRFSPSKKLKEAVKANKEPEAGQD